MTVCANGVVNVRNDSYGDDADAHIYSVNPTEETCTCPHHVHRGATCKHIHVVENSPLVASSARATPTPRVATDGGEPEETCDRCPTPLADVHAAHEATTVTTDGEELCRECADSRSGEEIGFVDARTEVDPAEDPVESQQLY
jgi:hypothetical protein